MRTLSKTFVLIAALMCWAGCCPSCAAVVEKDAEVQVETRTARQDGVVNFTCLKSTRCVAKTAGHSWIGTLGGLVRLDDKALEPERVYTSADGLAGTRVTALGADGETLWIGTDGGVSQLDEETEAIRTARAEGFRWRFEFDRSSHELWAISHVSALCFPERLDKARLFLLSDRASSIAREGRTLWWMTWMKDDTYRLTRLDTASGARKTTELTASELRGPTRLVVGSRHLWVLTELSQLRAGSRLFRIDKMSLEVVPQAGSAGLPHPFVQNLIVVGPEAWVRTTGDYDTEAHLGIGGRLCRYDENAGRWEPIPSVSGFKYDEPTCLAELDGQLWLAARSYNKTSKMIVAWGMVPIEREAAVVETLTLGRFQAHRRKWETFSVPASTKYDRIIALALQGTRLWFLLERKPLPESREGWKTVQDRVIPGYVDISSSRPKAVLFEEPLIPPPDEDGWRWRAGKPIDFAVVDEAVWIHRQDELWQFSNEQSWRRFELGGALPDSRQIRLFAVDGGVVASCVGGAVRFHPQMERWQPWGIGQPWRLSGLCIDPRGTWWLAAEVGRLNLPRDSERNDEDRKPLQGGLFRSTDGARWEVPSSAPWTWQQADVDGEVRFLSPDEVKRTPRDTATWGAAWADRPRPGVRRAAQDKWSDGISCVASDGGRVWVGTLGEGVFCLENRRWFRLWPKTTSARRSGNVVPRAPEDTIASLVLDGDSLWIATMAHLRRWCVSEHSLEKVDNAAVGFRPFEDVSYLEPSGVRELGPALAKAAGSIWFSPPRSSTEAGIYRFREDGHRWECVIPGTRGSCFAASGNIVWIGTLDGLLRYSAKTGRQKLFTVGDGLAASHITSVALDGHFIWVGTTSGISRLDVAIFQTR